MKARPCRSSMSTCQRSGSKRISCCMRVRAASSDMRFADEGEQPIARAFVVEHALRRRRVEVECAVEPVDDDEDGAGLFRAAPRNRNEGAGRLGPSSQAPRPRNPCADAGSSPVAHGADRPELDDEAVADLPGDREIVVALKPHDRRARVRTDDAVGGERPVGGERQRALHGRDERVSLSARLAFGGRFRRAV